MATKNGKVVAEFNFRNATKGAYRFEEVDPEGLVRTLYTRKEAFPNGAPKKIRVTI